MSDMADRIQAAWQRERPDIDTSSIGVITRIVRLARHLERARSEELRDIGTDSATLDVLATLRRAGSPYQLTPGELQRAALVTSGAITQRLDKLEPAGLVRREPHPSDGRVVVVQLTADGLREVDRVVQELMRRESGLLAPLTDADRANLETLLRRWLLRFESAEG
jgi:DNA-binding MarR family transcriptional regulator